MTATQRDAAGEDGNEGKAGGDGEGAKSDTWRRFRYMYMAAEMEALRAFAESVRYMGDIMDRVVTECAGGAIKEIHWDSENLDGTLPVGDLNMPKLRMMDLSGNHALKGEERERERDRERENLTFWGSAAHASSFLILSSSSPSHPQVTSSRSCSPRACRK
jgi:hypothetical protein